MRPPILIALLLAAPACGARSQPSQDLARLDREPAAANMADPSRHPELAAALGGQIMVDPQLAQGSNADAIRPPNRPDLSAVLGRLADWYYTSGRRAGYSARYRADGAVHVVGGTRGDAAYLAFLRSTANGGTEVDLVANGG